MLAPIAADEPSESPFMSCDEGDDDDVEAGDEMAAEFEVAVALEEEPKTPKIVLVEVMVAVAGRGV